MTALRIPRCSGCSRPLLDADPALGQDQVGPCCAALPEPWERSNTTGLYSVLPDAEESSYPQCQYCGSTNFVLRFTRTYEVSLRSCDPAPGDGGIFFENGFREDESCDADDDDYQLECAGCGRHPGIDWEWT